jgi:hypothetical protein
MRPINLSTILGQDSGQLASSAYSVIPPRECLLHEEAGFSADEAPPLAELAPILSGFEITI